MEKLSTWDEGVQYNSIQSLLYRSSISSCSNLRLNLSMEWEPLPPRKRKINNDVQVHALPAKTAEIERNIIARSERKILEPTLDGKDGVRGEFYECKNSS